VTLPLPLRNRLAGLIVESFHDTAARAGLAAIVALCDDPHAFDGEVPPRTFPDDLFTGSPEGLVVRRELRAHAAEFCERARRGWALVRARPLERPDSPRTAALEAAAALFDARLYFETHEELEPHWMQAAGAEREALQGLIQVAVGFQHLVNGNAAGARALLHDGAAKLMVGALAGVPLDGFAAGVSRCWRSVVALGANAPAAFDWSSVPRFPTAQGG
jgi:DUF309 family protein family protein